MSRMFGFPSPGSIWVAIEASHSDNAIHSLTGLLDQRRVVPGLGIRVRQWGWIGRRIMVYSFSPR